MDLDQLSHLVQEDPHDDLPVAPAAERLEGSPQERNRVVMTFRALCGKQVLPMWLLESDGMTVLAANEAAVQLSGYTRVDGSLQAQVLFPQLEVKRLRLSEPLRTPLCTHTGLKHEVELTPSVSYFAGQSVIFVVGRRILDSPETGPRDSDRYLDIANVAIVVTDSQETVLHWNQCAAELYGWKEAEVIGRPLREFFLTNETAEAARRALLIAHKWEGESAHRNRAGKLLHVHSHWRALRDEQGITKAIVIVNVDITAQKTLEAQYLRSQRLESIGTLASGIAHDLNNILTPILMSVGLLRRRDKAPENLKLLAAIESSAERGADIVRQVLTFARGVVGERVLLSLKPLINELVKIMAQTFPRNVSVRTELPDELWQVSGDATQIHQVLLNLCVNARDAMPEGGNIVLRASNVMLTAATCPPVEALQPGAHLLLEVIDSGTGIPPEVLDRIFDPFFTTKEPGKGTGLGLATVRGILKSHGGGMDVETKSGLGTNFKLYFPAAQGEKAEEGEGEQRREAPRGKGEMVLVVDDEPAVRIGMVSVLQAHGYQVYTAEDGNDALALFFQRKSEIDVILTDLKMEQMDGLQLARAAKRLQPETAIVVSSGHLTEEDRENFIHIGVSSFLEKPFKPDRLLHAIYDVLHAKNGADTVRR